MYTLRTFKKKDSVEATHIYLGDSYALHEPTNEQKEQGVKIVVQGNYDSATNDGIPIYLDEYAFIMTHLGGTFESLNKPKYKTEQSSDGKNIPNIGIETTLKSPSKFDLIDIFNELKFGRTKEEQEFLKECIERIEQ